MPRKPLISVLKSLESYFSGIPLPDIALSFSIAVMGILSKGRDPEKESKKLKRQEKAQGLPSQGFEKIKSSYKSQKELVDQATSGQYLGVSPQKLFQVVLIVGADRKYSISFIDKPSYTVTFQTNKREKFWDGSLSCIIIEIEGGCRISVTGNAEKGATTSGFSVMKWSPLQQMASDGAVLSESSKLKMDIAKQVLVTPEPKQEDPKTVDVPANSASDIPTQIRQLKELHDSGVLSAEEFEKAKTKLLG